MRILIIGLGSIGKKHVNAILTILPNAEIFALRSNKDADEIAGVINIFTFYEVGLIGADFAIISNPTSEHKNTLSKLVGYGIPVFIEKPLYSSLEIEELIGSINQKGIFTYVACNLRFLDCIRFIREKISEMKDKRLNEANVYCGSYLPDWRPDVDFWNNYSARAELGGGVHIDLIHELDYLYWLFGKPKKVNRIFKNQSSLGISAFDYANYLLDYEGFCANVILNYYRRDAKRSMELVFNNETWSVDLLENLVTSNGQLLFSSKQRIADTYKEQMSYFIHCLNGKIESFNTVNDAFEVLKISLGK